MSEFDLRKLVHEIGAAKDEWTLDELVDRILAATPRKDVGMAYRQALREYARVELANLPTSDSQPGIQTVEAHTENSGLGPNVTRSRSALARAGFRATIHVGPGAWKAIGLCTSAELLYAAAECDRMAEFNAQRAEQYRLLAKAMDENDAQTVQDLPTEIVEEVFGP